LHIHNTNKNKCNLHRKIFFFILKLVKIKLLTDLTIKLKYTLDFFKNSDLKTIILHPNNYLLKNQPKSNYLKIFELYGEFILLKKI